MVVYLIIARNNIHPQMLGLIRRKSNLIPLIMQYIFTKRLFFLGIIKMCYVALIKYALIIVMLTQPRI